MIVISFIQRKIENILKKYPIAIIADVIKHAKNVLAKLNPFYPHGGIQVPISGGITSTCVDIF